VNFSFRYLAAGAAVPALLVGFAVSMASPSVAQALSSQGGSGAVGNSAASTVSQVVSPVNPPPLPPSLTPPQTNAPSAVPVGPTVDATACNPDQLAIAIKAFVTANPTSAIDIVTYATQHCPGNAAGIAAAAASADPTDAAAIVVAVVSTLPPDQGETELAAIVVAVEEAVPGSTDQMTAAISQITFSQGPGLQGRGDKGAPLIAPWTDVPNSRTTSNSPI
jgi:hypothetical protein